MCNPGLIKVKLEPLEDEDTEMIDDQIRDHTNVTSSSNDQRKEPKTFLSDQHMDIDEKLSEKPQEYIYFSEIKDFS